MHHQGIWDYFSLFKKQNLFYRIASWWKLLPEEKMEINLCVGNIKISLSLTHSLSFYQLPSDRILWLHCLPQREKEIVCVCVCVCEDTCRYVSVSVCKCICNNISVFSSPCHDDNIFEALQGRTEKVESLPHTHAHTHFHTHACAHIFTHTFTQRALKKYGRCVP